MRIKWFSGRYRAAQSLPDFTVRGTIPFRRASQIMDSHPNPVSPVAWL